MLTILFVFIFYLHVSYKPTKYSDFGNLKIFSDFARVEIRYNISMGILDNFENAWDDNFEFESSSKHIEINSEICCNGCSCQTSSDHNTEFVQDIIDFEQ